MRVPVSAAIAVLVGVLILLGLFIPVQALQSLRQVLVQWAVILAAFALLVGVVNLLQVHWIKIRRAQPGRFYSLIIILSFIVTVVVAILSVFLFSSPLGVYTLWLFNYVQLPVESALTALLAVVLLFALIRLLGRRLDWFSLVFVAAAFLVFIGTAPLFFIGSVPLLDNIRLWITQVPAVAGARGILLGVALGAIAAGIRILMGVDRPYGG